MHFAIVLMLELELGAGGVGQCMQINIVLPLEIFCVQFIDFDSTLKPPFPPSPLSPWNPKFDVSFV